MKSLEGIMPAMAAQGVDVKSLIQQLGITTSTSSPTQTHTLVVEITGAPALHEGLKTRHDDGAKRAAEFSTFKPSTSATDILPESVATGAISAPSSTLATLRKRSSQPTDIAAFDSVPPKAPGVRRGAAGENSTGIADNVKHEAESVGFKVGALFGRSASPVMTQIGAAVGNPGDGASGLKSTAIAGSPVFRRSNGTLPAFRRDMWGSLDLSKRNDSSQLVRRSNDSAAAFRRDMLGSSSWQRRSEGNTGSRGSSVSDDPVIQARSPFRSSHKKASSTSSSGTHGTTSPADCVGAKKSFLPWPKKKHADCAPHPLSTSESMHQCDHKKTPVWKKVLSLARKKDHEQQHCAPGDGADVTTMNHAHIGGVTGSTGEGADGHHGSGMDHVPDEASDHDASAHDAHDSTGTDGVITGSGGGDAYDPNSGSGDSSGGGSDTTDSSSSGGTSGAHEPGMGSSGHGDRHDSTGSGSADDGAGDSTGDGISDNTGDDTGDGTGTGSWDGDGGSGDSDGSRAGSGSGDSSFTTKRDTEGHLVDDAQELDADDHALVTRSDGGEDRNVEESASGLMTRDAAVDEDESLEADGDCEHAQAKRDGRPVASDRGKRPGQSTASPRISKTVRKQKCKNGFIGFNRCLKPKCLPGQQPGPKCDCWYGIDFQGTCLQDGTPYKACGMGIKPQQSCLFAQVDNTGMVSKMVSTNKLKSGRLQSCQLGQRLTGKCACLLALNGKCMRIPIMKRLRVETFKATVLDADPAIGGAHGNMKGHPGTAASLPPDVHQCASAALSRHDANDGDNAGQLADHQE